jgi:N-methylhydantoinase B
MLETAQRDTTRALVMGEVLANHFRAIAEEMAGIVLRAAHTTFIKETQDYAAALVTAEGEVFAYPHSTGVTALLGIPMGPGTTAFDDWAPGDVMITNDPYLTQGMVMHLPDFYLFKPIFHGNRLVCFAWAFMHCSDVGGAVPGSTDMKSSEIFQEGLRLRPVKLYRRGKLNNEVWNIIADNCRIPSLNWGDVGALVASLDLGEKRIERLAAKYGLDQVLQAVTATLDRTEQRTRAVLRTIPAGSYRFVDYLEDDVVSDVPVRIELTLRVSGDGGVVLDYTGSDPQVQAALNLPTGGQRHHPFLSLAIMNFVVTQVEGLHLNSGIVRCIALVLPEHSVVNASFPASCGMRFLTAMRAHDAVLGALSAAVPGRLPAAGAGEIAVTLISTIDLATSRLQVAVANPVQGGTGGGPCDDGVTGIDYPTGYLRNVPAEVLESEMPVLVHRFAIIPDSEGAGRWRGGFGVEYAIEVEHPNASIIMRGKERYRFQPWGAAGGRAGSLGSTFVEEQGRERDIGKTSVYRPVAGAVLTIRGAGGGGFGAPSERDPERVRRDVLDGLVSPDRARAVYGVVLAGSDIDVAATSALRADAAGEAGEAIDLGRGRRAWEAEWGQTADAVTEWLAQLPARLRPVAKTTAWSELKASGAGKGWDDARLRAFLAGLEPQFRSGSTQKH